MILKFIAVMFVGGFVLKLLFARRLRGLGREMDMIANIFLVVVALYVVIAGVMQFL